MRVKLFYMLLLCLTALTVVLLVRVVGIVLVIALLTLPAAVAGHFVRQLWQMMAVAVLCCMVFVTAGLAVSFPLDLPSGPVIILIAARPTCCRRRMFSAGLSQANMSILPYDFFGLRRQCRRHRNSIRWFLDRSSPVDFAGEWIASKIHSPFFRQCAAYPEPAARRSVNITTFRVRLLPSKCID